jgi:hypothetical protein
MLVRPLNARFAHLCYHDSFLWKDLTPCFVPVFFLQGQLSELLSVKDKLKIAAWCFGWSVIKDVICKDTSTFIPWKRTQKTPKQEKKKNYAGVITPQAWNRKRWRCCRTAKYSRNQADSNSRPRRVWPDHGPLGFQGSYPKRNHNVDASSAVVCPPRRAQEQHKLCGVLGKNHVNVVITIHAVYMHTHV